MTATAVHTLRLLRPATPETPVIEFLKDIYAYQNSNIAGGSAASLEDYVTQVNNLERYFQELLSAAQQPPRRLLLGDISDALLAGAMKWQKDRGLAPHTANKLRAAIFAIVNFAVDELEMSLRRLKVKKFKVPKRKPKCWLPDEVSRIMGAARNMSGMVGTVSAGRWFLALELFVFNTGTRITAAMETPTSGLDLDRGWIVIPAEVQKHDSDEHFDLLPATVAALKAIQPHRNVRIFDDWPYDRGCRQWPTLNRWQRRVLRSAGLSDTRKDLFHKLRRSFATFIAHKGGKELARELCGHSHQSVTDLYIDERMSNRPRVADLLGDVRLDVVHERQKLLFD